MSDSFDVARARAILEKAVEMGMYEPGKIPEADASALVEAETVVAMCEQAEGIALEVGKDRVPLWPKVEAVLFVAKVVGGTEEAPPQTGPLDHAPSEQTPPDPATVTLPTAAVQPRVSLDTTVFVERGDPVQGEVWRDANQGEWEVLSYSGGQTIEVRSVATGESTIGPAGMLKARVREAPASEQAVAVEPTGAGPATVKEGAEDVPVPLDHDYPGMVEDHVPVVGVPDDDPAEQEMRAREDPINEPKPPAGSSSGSGATAKTVVPDDEGDEVYAGLLDDTERRYSPVGFPVPRELDRPPEGMPENLVDVDDLTARSLHSRYNSLAALARYRHDLEAARARACAVLRKLHLRSAMRAAREQLGRDATVTEVSQLAEDDDDVSLWTGRMTVHSEEADAYKTFLEMYGENVTVLSRDWTMRARQEAGS